MQPTVSGRRRTDNVGVLRSARRVRRPRSRSRETDSNVAYDGNESKRAFVLFFVFVAAIYCFSPVMTNGDSYSTFPTAVSILHGHTLFLDNFGKVASLSGSYTVSRLDGHLITYFPWASALFAVPAVAVLDVANLVGGPSPERVVASGSALQSLVQMWTAALVTAGACTALALLAFHRLKGPRRSRLRLSIAAGAVVAFGTTAWSVASRALWQHGPGVLVLALGLMQLSRIFAGRPTSQESGRRLHRAACGAGAAMAAAFAIRPTNAIALAIAFVGLIWCRRDLVAAFVAGVIAVLLPWAGINRAFYGQFLQPYFSAGRLGHGTQLAEALLANMVSPARGLLIFSPIAIFGIVGFVISVRRREAGPLEIMCAAVVVLHLLAVSLFPQWWAGHTFGPRYMTETIPFLFVLALPFVKWCSDSVRLFQRRGIGWNSRIRRATVVGVGVAILWSTMVHAQGGMLRASRCWNSSPPARANVDLQPSRVWDWSDPQFIAGLRAIVDNGPRSATSGNCQER